MFLRLDSFKCAWQFAGKTASATPSPPGALVGGQGGSWPGSSDHSSLNPHLVLWPWPGRGAAVWRPSFFLGPLRRGCPFPSCLLCQVLALDRKEEEPGPVP